MYRLSAEQTERLLLEPEYGMGYQLVEIREPGGSREPAVALNAEIVARLTELAQPREEPYSEYIEGILSADDIEVRYNGRALLATLEPSYVAEPERPYGGTLPGAPPSMTRLLKRATRSSERFARFSAYQNDRRVESDGSLLPGSFTTSRNDVRVVPSGFAAVGRYALPNPWPAVYLFEIVPGAGIRIECGTARPAFGQAGGGVEALFLDPTPPGSITGPVTVPEI